MTEEAEGPQRLLERKLFFSMVWIGAAAMLASLAAGQAITDFAQSQASWVPGLNWLLAVASGNDLVLRDANMPWEATAIAAFRLLTFVVLAPLSVVGLVVLIRRRAYTSHPDRLPLWLWALFIGFAWYGLFFDNVAFASYPEWYGPSRPLLTGGELVFAVHMAAFLAAFVLPWFVALTIRQRIDERPV